MGNVPFVSLIIFVITFLVAELSVICCLGMEEVNATFGCISTERNALLKFKASFSDPYYRLSSWNTTNTNCCKWQGVKCDKITRRVIGLDLRNKKSTAIGHTNIYIMINDTYSSANVLFSEKLDSSIMELKHLSFLDLSGNDFQLGSIPAFLGSMNQLQHLNLSYANFSGVVPHHLGNLSRLSVLDLSRDSHQLTVDDFMWVSRLSSLTHLDMSYVDLSGTKDLLKVLNMLPSIVTLRLGHGGLENRNLQHACVINSSTLLPNIQYLDLSGNSFDGELPCFLENMTSLRDLDLSSNYYSSCNQLHLTRLTNLVHLDLSSNSFQCNANRISEFLPHNCNLESLNLGQNSFSGDISKIFRLNSSSCWNQKLAALSLKRNNFYGQLPEEVGGFKKLEHLNLEDNLISGPIPTSISDLSALTELYLSGNKFNCSIPSSFVNLTSLKALTLTNNQLTGEIPLFFGQLQNLEALSIDNNYFNGTLTAAHFAKLSMLQILFVGNDSTKLTVGSDWTPPFQLRYLSIKSSDIGGQFPKWLHTQKELIYLYMSNCSISGALLDWLQYKNMTHLDLSHNYIEGSLPDSLREMTSLENLYLSNNRIGGSLPADSLREMTSLRDLDMSDNHIEGSLPHSLCEMTSLRTLDLSRNRISGNLPECSWANLRDLSTLVLSSNQLSGIIPNSIGGAYSLSWLQLGNNSFTGELPSTLRNCTRLRVLDIGHNKISGKLPKWIGIYLLNLEVLRLPNNELYDTISFELCQLPQLHILDLANNKLTGSIPHCFGNLSDMVMHNSTSTFITRFSLQEVMKGIVLEYFSTLRYLVNMDLSNNALDGEIPWELTRLTALHGLNLSHNRLQGMIPGRIGEMKSLESLDLSSNNLFGNIPESLSDLTFLSWLNLSHNNLAGKIPTGRQLQIRDHASFEGNPGLCGDPLPKKCHGNKAASAPNAVTETEEEEEDKADTIWFYGVVISGFATGLWGVIGVLVFKPGWRFVYFKFLDDMTGRIFGL